MKDFSAAINFSLAEVWSGELGERKRGGTVGGGTRAAAARAERGGGGGRASGSCADLAPLYYNRALVHVCLGDDASALDDLDRAVARDTRNIS